MRGALFACDSQFDVQVVDFRDEIVDVLRVTPRGEVWRLVVNARDLNAL